VSEKEEKKGPRIAELAAVVSVMVSILIASTTLLNNSGNLPSWWFGFSLILLIALIFFMPIMIFVKPVNEKIREARLGRKRDSVSRKYAPQFKDLVANSRNFNYDIRTTMDSLKNHYTNDIKSQLAMFVLQDYGQRQQEIDNILFDIEKEIDKSDKTFRNFYLIMKRFESVLDTYKRNLKIIEVFVHEIMTSTEKPIAKGIEAEFEVFREKYNDFIKDVKDFCHKINQETESYDFLEHPFEHLKKW
jgi:hypothetical protein